MAYDYSRAANQAFLEFLETPGMEKRALDAASDYTRIRVREDGVHRRVMPFLPIGNHELTRRLDSDLPYKVVDKEANNPPSVSVPFNTLPNNTYMLGHRYEVLFDRVMTNRFVKDIDTLRTWEMDLRQVVSDNAIKDMLHQEDSKFVLACNRVLGSTPGAASPMTGVVQYQQFSGGLTRDTWQESLTISPSTPSHLEVHTGVINNVFMRQFFKWGRDEMGGDFSQDVVKSGWSEASFSNVRLIITIKTDLYPNGYISYFPEAKFLGKAYVLHDTTMSLKREDFMLSFFAWETIGSSIGNGWAVTKAKFVS